MDSRKLPLSAASSPLSLSTCSWPLLKYSSSASLVSDSTHPPWSHFPHRDNVFLVIDTHRVPGYIQNDGKFVDKHTRLKVVWGLETMESLDLTSLDKQTIPSHDSSQFHKPAFMALGRSPSLAIKYFKAEDQTIRRFQIKFQSDTAYRSATALLEQANCPIGTPPADKHEPPSQLQFAQAGPPIPLRNNTIQVLRTPPRSSSGYTPSGITTNSTPSNFQQTNDPHSAPSYFAPQDLYPSTVKPSDTFLEDDIPPPRPPSSFLSGKPTVQNPTNITNNRALVRSIGSLPPLPKPTPVKKAPSLVFTSDNTAAYHGSDFNHSSRPRSGVSAFQRQSDNQGLDTKTRAGGYRSGLPEIVEEHARANDTKDRGGFPVFPRGYKKPELRSETFLPAVPQERQKAAGNIAVTPTTGARNPSIGGGEGAGGGGGGKRKQDHDDDIDEQGPKKQKGEHLRTHEEEEFRQVEDFIINAIHDDEFLRLLEMIGGVWQRMGFDEVRHNLSGAGA